VPTKKYERVVTFGTFDLLHLGHVRILQRAAELGGELIVGVSSDDFNFRKKGKYPVYSESDRMEIVAAIKGVTEVFLEESMERKRDYILQWKADCLVMGDDWVGRFDDLRDVCDVVYLPRTPEVSTTQIKQDIQAGIGREARSP
jgi:glycerol-3-phosphate cytidylyltransferase